MLGGLSMGGYVAMEIMRQAPERVEKLILIDTSARPDTEEQRRRRLGLLTLAQKGEFKGVTPRLLPLLLHPDHLADRILTQTIMQMASRIGRDGYLNQQRAIIGRVDSRPGLKNILCPTLVIVGREDTMTPPEVAEEMATLIPDAKLEIVEKSGHLPPLEQPLQITGMMKNFIADQGPV
jgi:pimeloyl-ACP methyl ester carboxylesterase